MLVRLSNSIAFLLLTVQVRCLDQDECKCVPFWECEEFNSCKCPASRTRTCQKNVQFCCDTTTLLRAVPIQTRCGLPKTSSVVRVLTPQTSSVPTIQGEMPWMVEIFQCKRRECNFKGGGSLIHPRVVLTAQHTVKSAEEQSLKIVAIGGAIFQNVSFRETDERNVIKIVFHPDYYSGGLYNDIALLILNRDYQFSDHPLNSICLPPPNQNFEGRRCLAARWAGASVLAKVDLPIIGFEQCQNLLRNTSLGTSFNLHGSFLCAGAERGKDTCEGDGGGPLICLHRRRFVLVGIVSWGLDCGKENRPGLYVDVRKFRGWIEGELGKQSIEITDFQV